MALFSPIMFVRIDASDCYPELHPDKQLIEYRIALGQAKNSPKQKEKSNFIVKIQLLIDGKVQPRIIPSYSRESFEKVNSAVNWLSVQYEQTSEAIRNKMQKVDLTEDCKEWLQKIGSD